MFENKVIILDEHPMYTMGLKYIINNEEGFNVVDCCHNYSDLLLSLSVIPADIVIIDCASHKGDAGLEKLLVHIKSSYPNIAIVMLGDSPQHQSLCSEMQDKIRAYLCKSFTAENIIKGLYRVRHFLLHSNKKTGYLAKEKEAIDLESISWLTQKEKTVIGYLQSGYSVTQTAMRVNRSVKTISTQKRTAMRKLGITSEKELYQLNLNKI
ncbi:response regulator transcription factor [Pantoea sp. USHLN256]|uniref:response regulator transcription factor n=1 Tax=Pantoea sp. USHLN256 TaxID=3081293 RepID=UPI0030159D3E